VSARAPARILVVDDEPLVRNVAKRLLERLGYSVETAEDGLEAVERLDRDDPGFDLVIIDGNMPRLNGMETARRIHARHPTLTLLFATGHFEPASDEDLAALGFYDSIEKPFSLEVFADTVARCLAR
jgi:two-component system cell cycle sensor histidine kinase/response regulator CckA